MRQRPAHLSAAVPATPRAGRLRANLCLAASLLAGVSSAWAQAYLPVGPQTNVPVATVTQGGWTECHRSAYGDTVSDWPTVQTNCAGARLMLACRATGSGTLQLLAQAARADVLTATGIYPADLTTTHVANGTAWYWSGPGQLFQAWGFAKAGDTVDKSHCDIENAGNGDNTRLCWQVVGYRCGTDIRLNASTAFERVLYAMPGKADLAITVTDGRTSVTAGDTATYTITATNAGPDAANGATITDALPATLTGASWTCTGMGGGTCAAAGSGNISDSVNLPPGASVTYTLTATVSAVAAGTLSNSAAVAPPAGVVDPNSPNNSATDTDAVSPSGDPALALTGTAGPVPPGAAVSYTLTATNSGPSNATGAGVAATFPSQLQGLAWTCVGAGGGTCTASGGPTLADTVNLPAGASVVYSITGSVAPTTTPGTTSVNAVLTAPAGFTDANPANNTATQPTAIALPMVVPTQSPWALVLVAGLLALVGSGFARRR